MKWLFIILGLVIVGLVLFVVIKCALGRSFLKRVKKDSLIIYGKKGHGKTLLFSEMSRMDKRTGYLSTTDFKHKGQVIINYDAVNVDPNKWDSVLNNEITQIEKHEDWEKHPVYLDDAGVFLPNFMDSELKKRYPSLPIAYAVWRHLYDAPIYINSQSVDRVYKLLREQADGYVNCRRTMRLFGLAIICCTYYDRINSAKEELSPMAKGFLNKFQKGNWAEYQATNGIIKDFWIFAPSWRNKYDSRYFHKVFFSKDWHKPKKKKANKQTLDVVAPYSPPTAVLPVVDNEVAKKKKKISVGSTFQRLKEKIKGLFAKLGKKHIERKKSVKKQELRSR